MWKRIYFKSQFFKYSFKGKNWLFSSNILIFNLYMLLRVSLFTNDVLHITSDLFKLHRILGITFKYFITALIFHNILALYHCDVLPAPKLNIKF